MGFTNKHLVFPHTKAGIWRKQSMHLHLNNEVAISRICLLIHECKCNVICLLNAHEHLWLHYSSAVTYTAICLNNSRHCNNVQRCLMKHSLEHSHDPWMQYTQGMSGLAYHSGIERNPLRSQLVWDITAVGKQYQLYITQSHTWGSKAQELPKEVWALCLNAYKYVTEQEIQRAAYWSKSHTQNSMSNPVKKSFKEWYRDKSQWFIGACVLNHACILNPSPCSFRIWIYLSSRCCGSITN